jgi:acyl carrier protein
MPDTGHDVRTLIVHRFPAATTAELPEDLDLGPGGLGLDSISLVELLLMCEDRFGMAFPSTLLDGGPLTVGRLARHVARGRDAAGA